MLPLVPSWAAVMDQSLVAPVAPVALRLENHSRHVSRLWTGGVIELTFRACVLLYQPYDLAVSSKVLWREGAAQRTARNSRPALVPRNVWGLFFGHEYIDQC